MKCGGNKLCENPKCKTCFEKSFASSDKAKYWSKENDLSPRQVFKGSSKKYIFDCNICGHSFNIRLDCVKKGSWCSYCSNKKLCGDLNCNICLDKSFLSSDKAEFWSEDNNIAPFEVLKKSSKKYMFDCDCGHSFSTRLDLLSQNKWCAYCSNNKLCDNLKCKTCFEKSFVNHSKVKYWSDLNKINPRNVFKHACKKYIFNCDCGHSFSIRLDLLSQNKWCPYCTNKILCDKKKCDMCFNKSFASSKKSKFFVETKTKPRNIFKACAKKYKFECENNHIFLISPNCIKKGRWCPRCVNKTEEKLHKWLEDNCYNPKSQAKFEWCKSKTYLPFDFCLEDFKILIELDGPQHFKQISNWESPDIVREKDIHKMKLAVNNGYTIIRLLQEDVWRDSLDWQSYLSRKIYCRKNPKILFCECDNQYKKHKKLS
ncbi:nuclease [Moumouvirus maliensis]|nr:nuclease [Moumouvirus maliensis]